ARSDLRLEPGKVFGLPAGDMAAVAGLVRRALEAAEHVVGLAETRGGGRHGRGAAADARPAEEIERGIAIEPALLQRRLKLRQEIRAGGHIGPALPFNEDRVLADGG